MDGKTSRAGRIAMLIVVIATVAAEGVSVAYWRSTDAQVPMLWGMLVIYGAIGLVLVSLTDRLVRWVAGRAATS